MSATRPPGADGGGVTTRPSAVVAVLTLAGIAVSFTQSMLFPIVPAAGSAICALSDTLTPLLAGRVLQGLSSGVIPLGISLMRDVLSAERLTASTAVMIGSTGSAAPWACRPPR